ncbi:MAG: alpha/beta hydrolase fold domain-containing protein [Mycobacterium sp.]|nr:alpha/beta hydrolase fold domain-containing protein [Mycobacterium sp.]
MPGGRSVPYAAGRGGVTAIEDAIAGYTAERAHGPYEKVSLAGDSAGGGLTMATAVALRDRGSALPTTLIFISPWVDHTCSGDSVTTRAPVPTFAGPIRRHHSRATGASPRSTVGGTLNVERFRSRGLSHDHIPRSRLRAPRRHSLGGFRPVRSPDGVGRPRPGAVRSLLQRRHPVQSLRQQLRHSVPAAPRTGVGTGPDGAHQLQCR